LLKRKYKHILQLKQIYKIVKITQDICDNLLLFNQILNNK